MSKAVAILSAIAVAATLGFSASAQDSPSQPPENDPSYGAQPVEPGAKGPDCLELYQIDHTQVLDDNTILFHMKGKKIYESVLPYRCYGLKFEGGFSYKTSIPRLCGNVDYITVLRRGNTCALGPFYEYTKPVPDEQTKPAPAEPQS